MRCPQCGSPLEPGAKECPCGWSDGKKPSRGNSWIIAISIIAVASLVAGLILLASGHNTTHNTGSYTVFYRCDNKDIAEPKTVNDVADGTNVTENALVIEGYTLASGDLSQTLTVKEGQNNNITFLYTEDSSDEIVGTWYLSSGDAPSLNEGDVADMWDFGLGSTLTVDADGSGNLTLAGSAVQFTWSETSGKPYAANIGGSECQLSLEDGKLVLAGYEDGNLYFTQSSPQRMHDGYVLPESDTRVYRTEELEGLTDYELCLARNELVLKSGQKVQSQRIADYYSSLGLPGSTPLSVVLNPISNTNLRSIMRVEWSRGSFYPNMLAPSRHGCYLAYSSELDDIASENTVVLAQLVDFDGTSSTFEELLVVYSDGAEWTVEVLGYSEGSAFTEYSEEISEPGGVVVEQYEEGCGLVLEPEGTEWGTSDEPLSCAVCYQLDGSWQLPRAYSGDDAISASTSDVSTLTQETLKTLKADYCDYSSFYGVWLSPIEDVDDAWAKCVELQALGFDSWKVQPRAWDGLEDADGYLVTAGRYATEADAQNARAKLERFGYTGFQVLASGEYHEFD